MRLLWLKTTRVSQLVNAFVAAYPGATILIDHAPETRPAAIWCTNRVLKAARDFSLTSDGVEILAFHDGCRNTWAHESARPLLDQLVSQRLTRYSVEQREPERGLLSLLVKWLFGSREQRP